MVKGTSIAIVSYEVSIKTPKELTSAEHIRERNGYCMFLNCENCPFYSNNGCREENAQVRLKIVNAMLGGKK